MSSNDRRLVQPSTYVQYVFGGSGSSSESKECNVILVVIYIEVYVFIISRLATINN